MWISSIDETSKKESLLGIGACFLQKKNIDLKNEENHSRESSICHFHWWQNHPIYMKLRKSHFLATIQIKLIKFHIRILIYLFKNIYIIIYKMYCNQVSIYGHARFRIRNSLKCQNHKYINGGSRHCIFNFGAIEVVKF